MASWFETRYALLTMRGYAALGLDRRMPVNPKFTLAERALARYSPKWSVIASDGLTFGPQPVCSRNLWEA
jgi:hypothetical protein